MSLNLQEIWKMQRVFNILVGTDTFGDPEKEKWFSDYARLLHENVIELFNCYRWNDQNIKTIDVENAKFETINCLHRLITLLHITMKNPISENADFRWEQHWKRFKNDGIDVSKKLFNEKTTDLLIHSTRLVGFKKINSNNIEVIKELISSIEDRLMEIIGVLGFEIEDILKIYKIRYDEVKNDLQWDDETIEKYVDDFLKEKNICH